jgi:hypothetical protein
MQEYKPIHFHIFNPDNALFKEGRNEKAEVSLVTCCNFDNCDLYKRRECSYCATFSWHRCAYGKRSRYEGYSKRAKRFFSWIKEQKELYANVGNLSAASNVMAFVGDYVFLPYAHMTMCESVPFLAHGAFLSDGNCFISKEHFTVENILKLVEFRPHALMGGEITCYQKEEIPKFLKHLSEKANDLFLEVIKKSEHAQSQFKLYSNIGRKAILQTLTPNIGKFVDIHEGEWIWDGEWLKSTNSKASFMLAKKFKEVRVKPDGNVEVKITDETQINKDTIFVN